MKRRLKINGMILALVVLLMAAFPAIFMRSGSKGILDTAIEILGITFILLGQIVRVSSRGYKSERSQQGNALIQDGPYALVRNPMYLGILLIGLGIVLMLFKWWVVFIFLSVFMIRYLLLIFKEEKRLLISFPLTYKDYCRKVPRIFPSLASTYKKDISEYLPVKLPWLKKEIGTILTVLLMTLLVKSWEDIQIRGIAAYLNEAWAMIITVVLFVGLIFYLNKKTVNHHNYVSGKSEVSL